MLQSTVPIKLALVDATGANVSSAAIGLVATQLTYVASTSSTAVQDAGNANPDLNFRYDAGRYVFNLSTKGLAIGTYRLAFVVTGDPVPHVVMFVVGK